MAAPVVWARRLADVDEDTTELDLSTDCAWPPAMTPEKVVALADMITRHEHLTTLLLERRALGDVKVEVLFTALKYNVSLRTLGLTRNMIGYAGAVALATVLKYNGSIQSLYLAGNDIEEEGTTALARVIELNSSITLLNLHNNNTGDAGAVALATALKCNGSVKEMYLGLNLIGHAGAEALSTALKVNTTVTKLLIDSTAFEAFTKAQARMKPALSPHEMVEWRKALAKHSKLDAQDFANRWYHGEVVDVISEEEAKEADRTARPHRAAGATLRVHFVGWADKYDQWFDRHSVRLQPECTILPIWGDFRVNDPVEMKVDGRWHSARVEAVDDDLRTVTCKGIGYATKTWTFGFTSDCLCAAFTHTPMGYMSGLDLRAFVPVRAAVTGAGM